MKGLAVPVAAAALLALGALVALDVMRPAVPPTRAEQAQQIAAGLRCPDCQSLSVAESHTAAAGAIREQIGDLLAQGLSAAEVRQHFVDRYGEWILLAPASAFAWWLPVAVVLAGALAMAGWLVAGNRRRDRAPADDDPAGVSVERQRIRDEIEQFDA